MAFRGHWLYIELSSIPKLHGDSAKTYFYQLRKGLLDDGKTLDAERMEKAILDNSTPPAAALRLKTFLDAYPKYSTPELERVADATYAAKESKKRKEGETLPTMEDLIARLEAADEKIKKNKYLPFIHWVVLKLATLGYPLRVAEMASISVNDPTAPNNYDLDTDTLTINLHKGAHRGTAKREYVIEGFGEEWAQRSMVTFGKLHTKLVGKEMTPDALGAVLRRAKISSQLLRPAVTTSRFREGATFDEKAALAHKMGHSSGVQHAVYNRP